MECSVDEHFVPEKEKAANGHKKFTGNETTFHFNGMETLYLWLCFNRKQGDLME